ncbi:hypothetical protein [Tenuifilum thalassicum]|uniref:Lipoprotein n=1 Tax=Tenuifilum thalassicum TaxID=2590900 RepID=A0A7D3XMD6_9BACT|nr:hypothetical protein [Tenuifilum thalassicum]QKG80096.1 hypothetical protein FHG85_07420 [Tenuifilum thalassicum]
MKTLKLLSLLLAGALFFVSCSKDEGTNLTKEEAQQVIQNADQDLVAETQEITSTDGYVIMSELGQILPQDFYNSQGMKSAPSSCMEKSFKNVEHKFALEGHELNFDFNHFILNNFNDLVGTWEYSPNGWIHTDTPTNQVVVKFPHPMDNPTNNVVVTYYDYSDQTNGGEVFINSIKVKIDYNGNEVFTFNYNGTLEGGFSFNSNGDSFNFKLVTEITVTFGKFEVYSKESFDATSYPQLRVSKNFSIKKDGSIVYAQIADVLAVSNNNQTVDFDITAKQIVNDLEFRLTIKGNSEELDSAQDPNQFIKMSLYRTNGDKVGDFIFVNEGGDWVVYFKFTSGEQVKAEELMPNLSMELERFFEEMLFSAEL